MNVDAPVAWLDEHVERIGEVEIVGERAWAAVLRAETRDGTVWLKAPAPATVFEVRLYPLLARAVPEHVLPPIAIDEQHGWLLLPDGGPSLGERLTGDALVAAMTAALPQYGTLQRALSADDLLAAGVADMRPAVMPERFDEAIAAASAPPVIAAERDAFRAACASLAQAPGGASLDHNDLHPSNILEGAGGSARFYDWGDAVVAHPFACMLVPLGWLHYKLGLALDDPAFLRARDSYLEVFADLAPHDELVRSLERACHVAKVARALIWHRAVSDLPPGHEHAGAPLEGLTALLDASFLSRV